MTATQTRVPPPAGTLEASGLRRSSLARHLLLILVVGALFLALTFVLSPFRNYQLATVAGYFCATAGLTVLIGRNGQLSLGHGALMAIGAYTVALAQRAFADQGLFTGWLLPVSLGVGVLVASAAGLVIGLAAARLHGPYLAGVTLALAVGVPSMATVWSETLGAEQGLGVPVEPPPLALGAMFPTERWQAWVALTAALLVMLLLTNLLAGGFGRDMAAVRDDEMAARLSGIDVPRTKVLTFTVSAACAGLGGGVFAFLTQSVSPGAYALTLSLFLVMAVVIGGLGSLVGAFWGALLLVALPELTHRLTEVFTVSPAVAQRLEGNLPLAIFGATLVVVMLAAPGGIQNVLVRAYRRLVTTLQRKG